MTPSLKWNKLGRNPLVFVGVIILTDIIILALPVGPVLKFFSVPHSRDIGDIVQSFVRIPLYIYLIHRLSLQDLTTFHPFRVKSPAYLLIPFVFPLVLAIPNFTEVTIKDFQTPGAIIALTATIFLAMSEEVLLRGLVLVYLISKLGDHQLKKSAVLSSFIFGVMHMVNLNSMNFISVFSQILFAFSMGIFFSGLLLKTRNLLYLGLIHALVNIGFDPGYITGKTTPPKIVNGWLEIASSVLVTFLIFSPLLLIGFAIIKNTQKSINKKNAENKIEEEVAVQVV